MTATFSVEKNQVLVKVGTALDLAVWRAVRDGREAARAASLPLCIDVKDCRQGDMGGIGSIQVAQARLASVKLRGCHDVFLTCFSAFGICDSCAQDREQPLGCTKRRAT